MINYFVNKLNEIKKIKSSQNKILINQFGLLSLFFEKKSFQEVCDINFSVFSQFNEDIILQYLIKNLKIKNNTFIEIGIENYEEANTRLLLEKNNWSGVVIDADKKNIDHILKQDYYWRHSLIAVSEFVTVENVNELIIKNKFFDEVGVLSIDIDGNDIWIWDSINVINPDILIIEYNAKFGLDNSYTIKYDKNFKRSSGGINKTIYGASLKALIKISKKKGYQLVATNLNGNNAFFVRASLTNEKVKEISLQQAFKKSYFREYLQLKNNNIVISDNVLEENLLASKLVIEI